MSSCNLHFFFNCRKNRPGENVQQHYGENASLLRLLYTERKRQHEARPGIGDRNPDKKRKQCAKKKEGVIISYDITHALLRVNAEVAREFPIWLR